MNRDRSFNRSAIKWDAVRFAAPLKHERARRCGGILTPVGGDQHVEADAGTLVACGMLLPVRCWGLMLVVGLLLAECGVGLLLARLEEICRVEGREGNES